MSVVQKYHYFYKITNTINNHFYYGIHSTNDLNDGYMGSGSRLKIAIKKYGIENFSKEIIKFFNNREELAKYEAEIVTESLVHDPNCYNMIVGGDCFITSGTTTVIDDKGNTFRVPVDDPMMYIKYKPIASDRVYCLDITDNQYKIVDIDEFCHNRERYVSQLDNMIIVRDITTGKSMQVSREEYRSNKTKYSTPSTNKVLVKDNKGNFFQVYKDDARLLNGELVLFWKNRKHSQETKNKISDTFRKNKHQQGEKNSQYGTCWIMKDDISKKIKKCDLDTYISKGWIKGRKCKK